MRLLLAFVAHEVRTQLRSLRFRVLSGVYLVLVSMPPLLMWLGRGRAPSSLGPATFTGATSLLQPFPTALVAAILAVDGIEREREEGSLAVVGLVPATSASYLLCRWLALLALLLPLTLIPPLVSIAFAPRPGEAVTLAAIPWLLRTLPVAIGISALALGLGTITGGTVSAAITAFFLFGIVLGFGNDVAAHFHRHITGPEAWVGIHSFADCARAAVWATKGFTELTPATDGGIDVLLASEEAISVSALQLAASALALGLSVLFLRRTRPDIRPLVVAPDHRFRNFVTFVNRLRVSYTPDPKPARADLAAIGVALLVAAGLVAVVDWRARRGLRLCLQRYAAEASGLPEPMPETLVPGAWRLTGAVARDGTLSGELRATLRNLGPSPVSHAAFALNPFLSVTCVAPITRSWDRLDVALTPPVPPGGETTVTFRFVGRPSALEADMDESFVPSFRAFLKAGLSSQVRDLSLTTTRRLASPRRVLLLGADLAPVPRYTSWRLTPLSEKLGEPGELVPTETRFPPAEITLDITAPPHLFLADSCGHVVSPAGRLSGACRVSPVELGLLGGPMRVVPGTSIAFAVLTGHYASARLHAPSLERAAELAEKAWPGLDALRGGVALEWPPEWSGNPWRSMGSSYWADETDAGSSVGRVFLLSESMLASKMPLDPESLAAQAIASTLLVRRPIAGREQLAFRQLLQRIVMDRLGKGRPGRALLDAQQGVRIAVTAARSYDGGVWRHKLPALVADLQYRLGGRAFAEGLEEFLDARDTEPGTLREMLDRMGRRAGVSLDRFHADFVAGGEIPLLTLEDVTFRRSARQWEVNGVLRNVGTGESLCPIVLRTDNEAVTTQVRVGTNESAPFRLTTPYVPRAVLLDPDQRAFRQSKIGLVTRIENRSGS